MNDENHGMCNTNEEGSGKYRIPVDKNGNSVLTGEGAGMDDKKRFTIAEIEVYSLK